MLQELLKKINQNQLIISKYRPFEDDALLHEIKKFYRVGIVYSSNALEGYTYTLSETKILLEDGLTAGGKPIKDAFAVIGLGKAYDYMFSLLHNTGITEEDILILHKMLSGSLENNSQAGVYRKSNVFITGSSYPVSKPDEISAHMNKLFSRTVKEICSLHPLISAARFHKEFVFIHPFGDGNGRIARLAMNIILIQKGFLPVIIPPILRNEYISMLEKAHKNEQYFIEFIARSEIETQKEFLRLLKDYSQLGASDENLGKGDMDGRD